jgi:hypothetical protein
MPICISSLGNICHSGLARAPHVREQFKKVFLSIFISVNSRLVLNNKYYYEGIFKMATDCVWTARSVFNALYGFDSKMRLEDLDLFRQSLSAMMDYKPVSVEQ